MIKDWGDEEDSFSSLFLSALDDYSADTIANLLWQTGLLKDYSIRYDGELLKFVFLHGNKHEIYSNQELSFISNTEDIIVFSDYFKTSKRGLIPCRVVAVRTTQKDSLAFCIAFTKILNKAINGFNICVIITTEGVVFSCKSFGRIQHNDFYISRFINTAEQFEEICENLMYSSCLDYFSDYYVYIKDSIKYKLWKNSTDPNSWDPYRLTYAYVEELHELETLTGLSFSSEIKRCYWGQESDFSEHSDSFAFRVEEADEQLFSIESNTINTVEFLIKAENQMIKAIDNEVHNESLIKDKPLPISTDAELNSDLIELLNDPETLIKRLKKSGINKKFG